jgi:hypothetical protein
METSIQIVKEVDLCFRETRVIFGGGEVLIRQVRIMGLVPNSGHRKVALDVSLPSRLQHSPSTSVQTN